MNAFAPFWEKKEPDFVNDEGVRWWLDKDMTKYAKRKNLKGVSLDYQAWIVKKPNNQLAYVLLDKERNPIYEHTSLEATASYIDTQKIKKGFEK